MILLMHILIALSSVAYTTYLYISPSPIKFKVSYGLIGSTILSGTYLVISTQANMVQACLTGLVYTGAMSLAVASAHRKFSTQKNKSDQL